MNSHLWIENTVPYSKKNDLHVFLVVVYGVFPFLGVIKSHCKITDYVVITSVSPMHSNTCDPTYMGSISFIPNTFW